MVDTMMRLNPVADKTSVTAHLRLVGQLSGFLLSGSERENATRNGSSSLTRVVGPLGGIVCAISMSISGVVTADLSCVVDAILIIELSVFGRC